MIFHVINVKVSLRPAPFNIIIEVKISMSVNWILSVLSRIRMVDPTE